MITFKIATPERVIYEDTINQVSVPTTTGEITILPHHVPLVSILQAGEMIIHDKEGVHPFAVAGGFLEVRENSEVIILADRAERAEEIDVERAEEARKRAEEQMIAAEHSEDVDFARLQALIDKEMNRMRVGRKYRRLRG